MSSVLAYLDPGSGSMILQALLGGVAGLFVAIKMFGVRIKETLFFWRKNEDEAPAPEPEPKTAVPEPASEPKVKTGV
jgi:hypothetical protein